MLPIVALRATAIARQKAVTRKIARLKKLGVMIEGSEFDPRVDPSKIARFTTKQLKARIDKLNDFVNRNTQFVGDAKGRPIPRQEFANYKRNIERAYNKMMDDKRAKVAGLMLPNGTTVGDRMKALKEIRKMTTDFDSLFRDSTDFVSRDALKKVGDSLRKQMTTAYQEKMQSTNRRVGREMMDKIGRSDLGDLLDSLSDEQFARLWQNTPFAEEAGHRYAESEEGNSGMVFSGEQDEELEDLIAWAQKL